MPISLTTWNVNGLRACDRYGFLDWFTRVPSDIVALQEIKCMPEQLEERLVRPFGYHSVFNSAKKPGYSGVAVYSKMKPLDVRYGMGCDKTDHEGRVLTVEFKNFILINAYFPNSQRDHARLGVKLDFCAKMHRHCDQERQRGKTILLCGDFNIAHQEIDLKNPKSNMKNAGFLPEERSWMSQFLANDYVDTFRTLNPEPGHYTWWSYRPGVREKNIGWRLDYFVMDKESRKRLKSARHQCEVKGSDHCPVTVTLTS